MRRESKAPGLVAQAAGADENASFADGAGAFERDGKPARPRSARGWRAEVHYREKHREYFVRLTNGITFVAYFGRVTYVNRLHARLEAELRGVLTALEWLRHEGQATPAEICFSPHGFDVFLGAAPCPDVLETLLDKVRRGYLTSSHTIRVDRNRRALVTREERLAA